MTGLLDNKIAFITGASRGIGQEIAKCYAQQGAHVIAIARDSKNLEKTDDLIREVSGKSATLIPFDLTEMDKIPGLAKMIAERFGHIDILVGNAGQLGELSPLVDQSADSWQKTMDINLHANFHLIRCFDPLLKLSDTPRAIFVSSGVADGVHPYWGAYAVSKASLEYMVKLYAIENEKAKLRANLINPGQVRTRMHAQAFPGLNPQTITPVEDVMELFIKLASNDMQDTGKVFHAQC